MSKFTNQPVFNVGDKVLLTPTNQHCVVTAIEGRPMSFDPSIGNYRYTLDVYVAGRVFGQCTAYKHDLAAR